MSDLNIVEFINTMTPEQRRGALAVLDHMSRPLTPREIEKCLVAKGVSRHRAVLIGSAVKRLHIIALVGGEHG